MAALTDETPDHMPSNFSTISTTSCFEAHLYSSKPLYQEYALKKLFIYVDTHWHEIIEHSAILFDLISDKTNLSNAEMAAYILSKCYYYLCDYQTSVDFALQSGNNFFLNDDIHYESTIATAAIDFFIEKTLDPNFDMATFPSIHKDFVFKIFSRSIESQFDRVDYQNSQISDLSNESQKSSNLDMNMDIIGMIIEANLSDILIDILKHFSDAKNNNHQIISSICDFIHDSIKSLSHSPDLGPKWFSLILDFLLSKSLIHVMNLETLISMLVQLNRASIFVKVLEVITSFDSIIQICLDVHDIASPSFLYDIRNKDNWSNSTLPDSVLSMVFLILSGNVHASLVNRFLQENAPKDVNKGLRRIKEISRHNVIHNAISITNGFLSFGTHDDKFLRDNMNWLSKFQCWSCFSASTSVGHIHFGNEDNPIEILNSFLPKHSPQGVPNSSQQPTNSASSNHNYFSEGGAYLALGFMNACRNLKKVNSFFNDEMDLASNSEFLVHGLCAGLGASAALSHDQEIIEKLKGNLFSDQALVGQSSAISIGLVAAGGLEKFEEEFNELQEFSLQTSHEKIMLGCGLGQALIVCLNPPKTENESHVMQLGPDTNISKILENMEPYIRLGAVNCVAMAYAGTNSKQAIRLLLDIISDDVSDMVKRGAVIALGFVLLRRQNLAYDIIEPLLWHHNQHIRFGAALAFGVCFASSGSSKALNLLMSLQDISSGFVNQAIYIACGMIINSNNAQSCSEYEITQRWINSACMSSHESFSVKYGSVIALGLMNSGGQNVQLSPFTNYGTLSVRKLSGLLIAMHYWFWYPLIQYFSLSFETTHMIILDSKLNVLDLKIQSDLPAEAFHYSKVDLQDQSSIKNQFHSAVLSFVNNKGSKTNTLVPITNTSSSSTSKSINKIPLNAEIVQKNINNDSEKIEPLDPRIAISHANKNSEKEEYSKSLVQSEAKRSKSSPTASQSLKKQFSQKVIRTRQRSKKESKDLNDDLENKIMDEFSNTNPSYDNQKSATVDISSVEKEEGASIEYQYNSDIFNQNECINEDNDNSLKNQDLSKTSKMLKNSISLSVIDNFKRILPIQRAKLSFASILPSSDDLSPLKGPNFHYVQQRNLSFGGIIVVSHQSSDTTSKTIPPTVLSKDSVINDDQINKVPVLFNALDHYDPNSDNKKLIKDQKTKSNEETQKNNPVEPPKPFIFDANKME